MNWHYIKLSSMCAGSAVRQKRCFSNACSTWIFVCISCLVFEGVCVCASAFCTVVSCGWWINTLTQSHLLIRTSCLMMHFQWCRILFHFTSAWSFSTKNHPQCETYNTNKCKQMYYYFIAIIFFRWSMQIF